MSDNVLRIEFQDLGSAPKPSNASATGRSGGTTQADRNAFDPIAEAGRLLEQERRKKSVQEYFNIAKYGRPEGDLPTLQAARSDQEKRFEQKQLELQHERQRRSELAPKILATQQIAGVAAQAGIPAVQQIGSIITAAMIGGPLAMTTAVASAALSVIKSVDSKVMSVARDAGEFSPQVAMAEAQAEIRRLQGDLRRAPELGPSLAKLTEAESKLDEQIRDLFTSSEWLDFKATLVELLTVLVEAINYLKGIGKESIGNVMPETKPFEKGILWELDPRNWFVRKETGLFGTGKKAGFEGVGGGVGGGGDF